MGGKDTINKKERESDKPGSLAEPLISSPLPFKAIATQVIRHPTSHIVSVLLVPINISPHFESHYNIKFNVSDS